MNNIVNLQSELNETNIANKVGIPHDTARMSYPLKSNTVKDIDEFKSVLGEYVNHHYTTCISKGGKMSLTEAVGIAKEILDQEYRRRGGDFITAYNDAHEVGLRGVLDVLAEELKVRSIERFIQHTFDKYVAPNSWDQKVHIIREFIAHCGSQLSSSIDADKPERYAANYYELIRQYTEAIKRTSAIFRRF